MILLIDAQLKLIQIFWAVVNQHLDLFAIEANEYIHRFVLNGFAIEHNIPFGKVLLKEIS